MTDLLTHISRSPDGGSGGQSRQSDGETLFYALFEAAADPVLLFDLDDTSDARVVEANHQAVTRFGFARSELVGKSVVELEPDVTPELLDARLRELREFGKVRFTTTFRGRDGEPFPIEISASAFAIHERRFGVAWVRDAGPEQEGRTRSRLETRAAAILAEREPGRAWAQLLDLLLHEFNSPHGLIAMVDDGSLTPVASRVPEGVSNDDLAGCCSACRDAVDRRLVVIRDHFAGRVDAILGAPVLAAPVVFDGETIALLALAGRATPYMHVDADRLDELAAILAPIFHGQREALAERSRREEAERNLQRTADRLAEAQRLAKLGSWELDIPSGHLVWSPEVYSIFEIHRSEHAESYELFLSRVHPLDREMVEGAFSSAVEAHRPYEISHRILTTDGRTKYVEERGRTIYATDGTPLRTIGTVQDVTEQHLANEQLRLAASMFETSAEGILIADSRNRIVTVNRALERMFGFTASELIGETPRVLRSGRHDRAFYAEMWSALRDSGRWVGEVWDRRKSGEEFPVDLTITAVRDTAGKVTHYAALMRDITAQKRTEARIFQLAFHDQLTGLPNRGLLRDRLDLALSQARRGKTNLAVLFLDLDRFKNVNDSFGHDVGDALLVEFARRIRHAVRASDTVSRQGGDEFVVVLPNIGSAVDAARVADSVIQAISAPFEAAGREITITTSIGLAVYPANGLDADTLMRNADAAMYAAKASGRNCYRFFTDDLNRRAIERLSLENDLRRAIDRGEFVLYFQPQFELATNRLTGVEALIRWIHPTRGTLGPDQFVPIAEETRLILEIDAWVLREACATIRRWRDNHVGKFCVGVNVSAEQLRHNGFREVVQACMSSYGVLPEEIELEFTETVLIEDQDVVLARLADIRSLGVSITIDDFGTGFSSLSYLPRMAASRIKLAAPFVRGIDHNPQNHAVASAMIDLAHRLKMQVVAEGVESSAELDVLREIGCDCAQGYLLARPLSEAQLLAFVSRDDRHPG